MLMEQSGKISEAKLKVTKPKNQDEEQENEFRTVYNDFGANSQFYADIGCVRTVPLGGTLRRIHHIGMPCPHHCPDGHRQEQHGLKHLRAFSHRNTTGDAQAVG